MPPTYQTLLVPAPAPLRVLEPTQVRLMPFHLSYTGPAQTDVYFQPRSSHHSGLGHPSREEEEVKKGDGATGRVAAFRGREVHEHLVSLPPGYIGYVLSAPPKPTRRTEDVVAPQTMDPTAAGGAVEGRSMRKRKAPVERAPVAKRTRKAVPVQRFSLDDDEGSDGADGSVRELVSSAAGEPIGETDESQIEGQTTTEAVEVTEPTREPLHHTMSLAIVDSMIPEETEPTSPPPSTEETASWVHTRRLVPEATFEGISVWCADEALYTVPSTSADEGSEKVVQGAGVTAAMGERDEFVRALYEWRRVAEVVHAW